MNTRYSRALCHSALIVTLLSLGAAQAQTTYDWNSGAPDGNWKQGAGGHRWGFDLWDEPPAGGGTVLRFNNNTHVVMTNNVSGYSVHGLIFGSSATTSRTLNGNSLTFFDNGGNGPFIRNESSTAHTINLALIGDNSGDPLRVQLDGGAGGNLTFGSTINNNGSNIEILGSAAGAKTVTFQGVISGSGGFFANHANVTTIFDAQNTMTGQLTINAGTVRLGGAGATFGGSSQNIRIGTNAVLDLNGISTTVGSVGEEGLNDGGTISLGSATLTVGGNSYETFQNGISGTGSLVKSGSGTLNLYGSQSYSGSTTVNGGILSSSVAMSTASVTVGGGTFRTTAANVLGDSVAVTVNSGTYSVGGSDTIGVLSGSGGTVTVTNGTLTSSFNSANNTFSGTLTGAGAFTKAGSGTLTLAGSGANTISGGVTVSAGELVFGKSANTAAVGGAVTVNSGALLRTTAANQFNNNLVSVNGSLDMGGNGQSLALRGSGTVTLGSATLTNNVTVSDSFSGRITGAGGVVKSGSGLAIFSGASDYDGATAITGGTLEIQNATALGSTVGATTVSDGAILRLSNATSMTVAENITINGTTGDGSLQNMGGNNTVSGNITLGLNSRIGSSGGGSLTLSGAVNGTNRVLYVGGANNTTISGGLSGAGSTEGGTITSLFKDGAGTLTLSGNNTYSGDTRVTAGVLTVASGGNLGNGTSDVFVSGGANLIVNANAEIASLQETAAFNKGTNTIGAGATLTVSGNGYSALSTSIRGAGDLIKSGTGTMILVGTQDRTGSTTVTGGRLETAGALSTTNLVINGGTFAATAANILGDNIAVSLSSGTYSLGGADTIGSFSITGGEISGANTLTASTYALNGGTVTANLGAGAATATSGTTALNGNLGGSLTANGGTVNAAGTIGGNVTVGGGTVNLGASDRIGNSSAVSITSGTLGISTFTDTVGSFSISGGTLGGSGTLTAATYALNGGTVTASLGAGAATATSGTTALNGNLGGSLTANGGTVNAAGTIGGNVTVGGGTVNLGASDRIGNSSAVSITSGTLGLSTFSDTVGSFAISGGTLGGSGTLTAATYALNGGAVNAKLGAGAVTVADGTTALGSGGRLDSASTLTVNSGQLTLGGSETVASLAGSGGTIALGSSALTTGGANTTTSFAGVLSGNGSLVKNGTGSLTLSGINLYSGGTTLNGGWLIAGNNSAFGTGSITVGSGTTLNLTNFNINNVIINNGGTILSTGTLADVIATNGTTDIAGSNSSIETIGGTAVVNVTGSSVVVTNASGGTLNASGSGLQVASVSGTAAVNLGGTGAQVGTVSGGTVTISNTATGSSVATASAGTVNANAAGVAVGTISNTATVNVGGADARVTTLAGGTVNANASGLVVTNFNGGNIAVSNGVTVGLRSGSSSGVISGSGGVAKQGNETLTLSGNNTFSGATTIESGKLVVNGSISNSTVTVQEGGILGGTGVVGATTVQSGGTLDPGNSPGTQFYDSGLTLLGGGNYNWQIYDALGTAGAPDGWDLLAVSGGAWDISGLTSLNPFNINLWSLSSITPDANGNAINFNSATPFTWEILTYTSLVGTFDSNLFAINTGSFNGTSGFSNDLNGGMFSLEVDGNSLNLLFTPGGGPGPEPIPELGTWAAAALLAGAAGFMRWRRRKEQAKSA
jgi:fibronectin-binding autotransporter adhesin